MSTPTPTSSDTPLRILRLLALAEGLSFLVILFVTMPLKYLADAPQANALFGMAHGVLFVLYLVYLGWIWADRKWSMRTLLYGLGASFIPFFVFWVERHVFRGPAVERRR